ncbi:COX5A-domain-containing protein [Aureobasidium pullulans]|nr:COX5A-domain-containing protein [Aureobasidium pullulans]
MGKQAAPLIVDSIHLLRYSLSAQLTMSFFRVAARAVRAPAQPRIQVASRIQRLNQARTFSVASVKRADVDAHDPHHEESFEEFTARYEKEFEAVQDVFELQRNLNNAFAYDLVPAPSVIVAALKAARRVNDFPTAVRVFEGIKAKVENQAQYDEYLTELESLRKELGIELREAMYPESS